MRVIRETRSHVLPAIDVPKGEYQCVEVEIWEIEFANGGRKPFGSFLTIEVDGERAVVTGADVEPLESETR